MLEVVFEITLDILQVVEVRAERLIIERRKDRFMDELNRKSPAFDFLPSHWALCPYIWHISHWASCWMC